MNPKVKSQRSKDNVLRLMFLQPAGFTLLEVLVASTKRWLVEAAYEAAKGRPLSELAEKFDELSTSDLPSAKDGGNT